MPLYFIEQQISLVHNGYKYKKSHGIISAIKTELNNQGYDTSETSGSIWTQVMEQVQAQNEQNKTEGKKEIYRGGSNLFGSGHSNFIVKEGIIQLSKTIRIRNPHGYDVTLNEKYTPETTPLSAFETNFPKKSFYP